MKPSLWICLLCLSIITSGCWDRTEINDLAFITGSSFDLTEKGECLLSVQIAVPSSGQGGTSQGIRTEKFIVLSAVGLNADDAFQRIQKKSSRRLFTAHRSVIFIGEALAKKGINNILDVYTHDPKQRLKTYMLVVKGGEGREILLTEYPFEQVPVEAVKEMEALGSELPITLRDFFTAASSEGISPVMGVIESESIPEGTKGDKANIFKLAGSAIFKDLKLAGFLNEQETNGLLWLTNRMKNGRVDAELPEGAGNVGMFLTHSKRKMTSEFNGDTIKFNVKLQGKGSLFENNSKMDISRPSNLDIAQKAMEQSVEKQVQAVLTKLQTIYKVDSVGFGQDIRRNDPKRWKALKAQWDKKFPDVDVTVDVKLTMMGAGMAGPPLQLKEEEIIK